MSRTLLFALLITALLLSACSNDGSTSDSSGPKQVAFLVDVPPDTPLELLRPYIEDPMSEFFAEYGYIQGENIEFTTILSGEQSDLAEPLAGFDAIYAAGAEPLAKAINTGLNIPTVFFFDEVELQTDTDLRRQIQQEGSLITGVLTPQVHEKRFALLMEIDPSIERVFVPYDPGSLNSMAMHDTVESIAPEYGVTIVLVEYTDIQSAQRIFRDIPDDVDAIFAGSDAATTLAIESYGTLTIEKGIPLADGIPVGLPTTLLSYGANVNDGQRIVARFIAQILDGTQPADLPVEIVDPQLIISLGAADALGLEVPMEILEQANVILREEVVTTTAAVDTAGFCNATLDSALGAAAVCVTAACDSLEDTSQASYTDRETVDSCAAEGALGVCTSPDMDVTFYEGDVALIQAGCQLGGGTWLPAEE